MIGPKGRSVAMRMKPKKEKERLGVTISRMRIHAAFELTDPNTCMCGGALGKINCAIFLKNDPRVSVLADPEIWHFPLTLLVVLTTLSHYRVSV